jgi:E1A/CREB-binding protein
VLPASEGCHLYCCTAVPQAKEEGTVAYVSNMWDTYFEGGRDHRLDHLSVTQLPYYDGQLKAE